MGSRIYKLMCCLNYDCGAVYSNRFRFGETFEGVSENTNLESIYESRGCPICSSKKQQELTTTLEPNYLDARPLGDPEYLAMLKHHPAPFKHVRAQWYYLEQALEACGNALLPYIRPNANIFKDVTLIEQYPLLLQGMEFYKEPGLPKKLMAREPMLLYFFSQLQKWAEEFALFNPLVALPYAPTALFPTKTITFSLREDGNRIRWIDQTAMKSNLIETAVNYTSESVLDLPFNMSLKWIPNKPADLVDKAIESSPFQILALEKPTSAQLETALKQLPLLARTYRNEAQSIAKESTDSSFQESIESEIDLFDRSYNYLPTVWDFIPTLHSRAEIQQQADAFRMGSLAY